MGRKLCKEGLVDVRATEVENLVREKTIWRKQPLKICFVNYGHFKETTGEQGKQKWIIDITIKLPQMITYIKEMLFM